MSLLANVVGFSLFGLAARVGQLGIQKRNIFESASAFPSLVSSNTRLTVPLTPPQPTSTSATPPDQHTPNAHAPHDCPHVCLSRLTDRYLKTATAIHCRARPDPVGHAIAMGAFGFVGYWAYQWDQRAAVLLQQKRAEIAERRAQAEAKPSAS
ncbi:hypothetical protein C8Q77DRAFT_1155718 [Trametes polyzona]|nr:hypothetical protein C8Q77DRAFT_1155718 [Trametes polyzona]